MLFVGMGMDRQDWILKRILCYADWVLGRMSALSAAMSSNIVMADPNTSSQWKMAVHLAPTTSSTHNIINTPFHQRQPSSATLYFLLYAKPLL